MGAAASAGATQFVKVEIDPPTSARGEIEKVRVDDACVFLTQHSTKVIASGQNFERAPPVRNSPRLTTLLSKFEEMCGAKVSVHTVVDKGKGQVLVTRSRKEAKNGRYGAQFHLVPNIEPFSRISGICKILGDRAIPSNELHTIRVGDLVRIGSVGLVVTETRNSLSSPAVRMKDEDLWVLKARAYALVSNDEAPPSKNSDIGVAIMSPLDSGNRPRIPRFVQTKPKADVSDDESDMTSEMLDSSFMTSQNSFGSSSKATPAGGSVEDLGRGQRVSGEDAGNDHEPELCYVCCDDDEVVESNPLVSACACSGGTRWMHLKCLERLMAGPGPGMNTACVMFHSKHRRPVCKVCCAEYAQEVKFEGPDGATIPVPQPTLRPPYICFKVVTHSAHTRHQGSIFNSSFHVSFAGFMPASVSDVPENEPPLSSPDSGPFEVPLAARPQAQPLPAASRPLVLGRSNDCDVPLNYQTVSGHHAALHYGADGKFSLQDLRSSNGTFAYIREPLPLVLNQPVRVRMGRRTLKVTAVAAPIFSSSLRAPANPGLNRPTPQPSFRHRRRVQPAPPLSPGTLPDQRPSAEVPSATDQLERKNSTGRDLAATLAATEVSELIGLMAILKPGGHHLQSRRHGQRNLPIPGPLPAMGRLPTNVLLTGTPAGIDSAGDTSAASQPPGSVGDSWETGAMAAPADIAALNEASISAADEDGPVKETAGEERHEVPPGAEEEEHPAKKEEEK